MSAIIFLDNTLDALGEFPDAKAFSVLAAKTTRATLAL
jgi:hypothetical protein